MDLLRFPNLSQFATGTVKKRKGSLDYGTASMVVGKTTDSGLAAMKSGFDGANKDVVHSFKVVESDSSIGYFTAVISSYVFSLGDANTITRINCNVDLTNKSSRSVRGIHGRNFIGQGVP